MSDSSHDVNSGANLGRNSGLLVGRRIWDGEVEKLRGGLIPDRLLLLDQIPPYVLQSIDPSISASNSTQTSL